MKVPLLDLHAQFQGIRDEVLAAIGRVCDAQRFVLGPEVEALERELARVAGTRDAIGVSSGTDALLVALMALGVGSGDEVIVPTYSFFATAGSVSRLGARAVFVDIDPATFNIDPDAARRALSARTKAIIPVHLFGQSAEMAEVTSMAREAGIAVVEDAAQAIGARYRDQPVGSLGTLGCFSFYPSKNLGACGDGGLVTTNDQALAERVRLLRSHGASQQYRHEVVGGNFRLDALQAAVLRVKLPHLPAWTACRQANAARYRQLFAERAPEAPVRLPVEAPDRTHIYNQFVLRVPARDALRAHLAAAGIGTEVYYPLPFHLQPCFASLGYRRGGLPEAERASAESLALPVFPELSEEQQRYVVEQIADFYHR
ncbi:MAG: aminotransferase class I/II-fold pyridoxal phosphate-dependent enzyme [Luteitalea sp.]|nr:aminotransferase class I/II-fold pyridoxal phosphate-dependent enzyme [Luteitalea sp.]